MPESREAGGRNPILRSRAITELLQRLRFRITHLSAEPPIVVHQMARVGSITVLHAILEHFPRRRVFHTHYLNPATVAEHRAGFDRQFRATGRAGLHREYLAALHLARALARGRSARGAGPPRARWRVVSMVRDPVARTVSAFFRHFAFRHPELPPRFHLDPGNVPRLVDLFLDEREPERRVALEWFDREVAEVLGVDVFATPFPAREGVATYASATCDLLVLRTEDIDRVGEAALARFLSRDGMSLRTKNRGSDQAYGAAYGRFLREIELPRWYLDEMYGSRLARHFYGEAELAAFRKKWQRAP